MPAHSRGSESVESYLTRVLAALCRQQNGEVRLKGALLDSVPGDEKITIDWDASAQELCIRVITGFGEVYRIDGASWPTRTESQPAQPKVISIPAPTTPAPTQVNLQEHQDRVRATTMDTERLAELENKMIRERLYARIRRDTDEMAREMGETPEKSSTG